MKKSIAVLFVLALSTMLVPAVYADGGCSNATLTGSYSGNFRGWFPAVDKKGHLVLSNSTILDLVGIANFDGAGNVTTSWTACGNGACGPASAKGTYSVKSDCTGKIKLKGQGAGNYNIAIANGGSQFYLIYNDTGANVSGTATKQ